MYGIVRGEHGLVFPGYWCAGRGTMDYMSVRTLDARCDVMYMRMGLYLYTTYTHICIRVYVCAICMHVYAYRGGSSPGDNFDRDNFDRGKFSPPPGILRLVVIY